MLKRADINDPLPNPNPNYTSRSNHAVGRMEMRMTEFKGTPGPWGISTDSSDYGNSWWYVVGPATVMSGRHFDDSTVPTADAHLIAAAPELLEALMDARYALYGRGPGNPKIDAAIAKALGVDK